MPTDLSPSGSIKPSAFDPVFDRKTDILARLLGSHLRRSPTRILVVGCGNGIEAATLAKSLDAPVVGIDIEGKFDPAAAARVDLRTGNATQLDFGDRSFDLVYSYHALEHISDPKRALLEMRRVLVDDGHFCIGTPNRARAVGYLGSKSASKMDKIRWNVADWKARLRNQFSNEYGAHAGFYQDELRGMLRESFSLVEDITLDYYSHLYSRHTRLISVLEKTGMSKFAFPAIYFCGRK